MMSLLFARTIRSPAWFGLALLALLCVSPALLGAQPYGLESRPNAGAFLNGAVPGSAPVLSGNWTAVIAFTNFTFLNAVGLAHVPGTPRLVVWEREGRIYSFTNSPDASSKTLVLNITNQCQGWDDSGLLGVAFHPGFVSNRFMFVWYTWVTPGTVQGNQNQRPPTNIPNRDRLSRFTLDANGVAIPGSETVFIDQNANSVWHNGGGMFFGDDGFLYITNGDDANGANNQRINVTLHSGVLRIDVDQRGGAISHPIPRRPSNAVTTNYFIPNDNPFVGQAGALEEFFCIGLRSPHRMTFDPVSRRIFIGDVGEGSREEISVVESGESALNFQWNRIEGLNGDLTPPYIGVNKRPVIDYSHSEGFAVIGGYVYRGSQFAADLGGKYIFGDNGSKRVWVLDESTIPATKILLTTVPPGPGPNPGNDYVGLSSFGLDANGEIYMCQMSSTGGRIYKLQRGGPTNAPLPQLLSQTGVFTNLATLGASRGLLPFDVASPLWSDGAVKSRWMAIPSNQMVTYSPTGEWTFPNGSVFVKHFELPVNETNPAIRKRLETRLLVRDTNGAVYGATYKWRADESDADLLAIFITHRVATSTINCARGPTSVCSTRRRASQKFPTSTNSSRSRTRRCRSKHACVRTSTRIVRSAIGPAARRRFGTRASTRHWSARELSMASWATISASRARAWLCPEISSAPSCTSALAVLSRISKCRRSRATSSTSLHSTR
ncbi:MAG TPA: PQQ-dependent sugar dehydrogenase [Candidatus Limnocylindria bacterium]|nr:PQQ-dependent sugar dehydrogenase [Candidatus Limnocylindria bacterium]